MSSNLIHGSGKDNANWKGGIGHQWAIKVAKKRLKWMCSICSAKEDLEVHHKDGNINNNIIENLQVVCPKCHASLHKEERLKATQKIKKGKLVPCDYCGALIYRPRWQLRITKHSFCSQKCMSKWRKECRRE